MNDFAEIAGNTLKDSTLHAHLVKKLDEYLVEKVENGEQDTDIFSYCGVNPVIPEDAYEEFLKSV